MRWVVVPRIRLFVLAAASLVAASLPVACTGSQTPESRTAEGKQSVILLTPMSHPSLNLTAQGIQDGLASEGFTPSALDLRVVNANGDFTKVTGLTREAIARKPTLIVVLTTPAASEAVKLTSPAGIPLVYAAVTDPVAANVVTSMEASSTLATGISDRYPVSEQVGLFLRLKPSMKTATILYNPDEQNSRILVQETSKELAAVNVTVIERHVRNPAEVAVQAKLAAAEGDAVIVNGDNLVIENLEAVISACATSKKPLFVGDPDSVKKGAVATVGPSYRAIGFRAGLQAARVLRGEDVRTIPSEYPAAFEWVINTEAARKMSVPIPPSVWQGRSLWTSQDDRGR